MIHIPVLFICITRKKDEPEMKKKLLIILLFSFVVFSVVAIPDEELNLELDLDEGSYLFGLSSNPVNDITPQPNDIYPVQLASVEENGNTIGVIGAIHGNENGNELHFYWNVASNVDFEVLLGVSGAMKAVTTSEENLDWTVSVVDGGSINKDDYNKKVSLYKHSPSSENGERNSYSSREIQIFTDPAEVGTYNGTLIFSIST